MAGLLIQDEQLTWQLLDIARRENRPVEAVLSSMVATYTIVLAPTSEDENPNNISPNPLQIMLALAEKANLTFSRHDVSENTREILETEYADYLLRRMREEDGAE